MSNQDVIDSANPGRVIRLTFTQKIRAIDAHTIEVDVRKADYPVFSPELIEAVHRSMGMNRGELLLDDVANDLLRRVILDGVSS